MKRLTQTGDTIVEVLIALVIVSTIMGGAYLSSNSSLTNSRQSQERGEALKYVETHLERLRANAATDNGIFSEEKFCFDTNGTVTSLSKLPAATAADDDFSTAEYPTACNYGGIPYHLSVVQDNTNNVFVVRARWDSANGKERDEVKILYRVDD